MTADVFDPYDDFPDVVPVPLPQAIEKFRAHWGLDLAKYQAERRQVRDGTQRSELRKRRQLDTEKVELQLFRSIMASNPV